MSNPNASNADKTAAALTIVSLSTLLLIAAYQTGLIDRLPEPRAKFLAANRIHRSKLAYPYFGIPDSLLGIASYTTTLSLLRASQRARGDSHPGARVLAGLKATFDVVSAANLTRKSWVTFRAFSLYSLMIAGATISVLPCILPGAWSSARRLYSRERRRDV